jgi:hypothetical protein
VEVAALYLNVTDPTLNDSSFNSNVGVMTPSTSKTIDKKIDDGTAVSGRFQAYTAYFPTGVGNCLSGTEGSYRLNNAQNACMAFYILE